MQPRRVRLVVCGRAACMLILFCMHYSLESCFVGLARVRVPRGVCVQVGVRAWVCVAVQARCG